MFLCTVLRRLHVVVTSRVSVCCAGYTWLPLLDNDRLRQGDFLLPVSLERPPPSYYVVHPDVQLPNTKWVDGHKGLFSLGLHTVSAIHTLVRPASASTPSLPSTHW